MICHYEMFSFVLKDTEKHIADLIGPSTKERWVYWRYSTEDQDKRYSAKRELDKILNANFVSMFSIKYKAYLFGFTVLQTFWTNMKQFKNTWKSVGIIEVLKKLTLEADFQGQLGIFSEECIFLWAVNLRLSKEHLSYFPPKKYILQEFVKHIMQQSMLFVMFRNTGTAWVKTNWRRCERTCCGTTCRWSRNSSRTCGSRCTDDTSWSRALREPTTVGVASISTMKAWRYSDELMVNNS